MDGYPHLNAGGQLLFNPAVVESVLSARAAGDQAQEGEVGDGR